MNHSHSDLALKYSKQASPSHLMGYEGVDCIVFFRILSVILTMQMLWYEETVMLHNVFQVLTLASNERVPLTSSMRLVFEISHLKTATPATVSRAGILYVNQQDLGWNPWVTVLYSHIKAFFRFSWQCFFSIIFCFMSHACCTKVTMLCNSIIFKRQKTLI